MAHPPRILVTRSEPGASETADRLRARGHDPVVEPLFALKPVPADIPAFDALAFTSANGARLFAALGRHANAPVDVPVFAVGDRTASAAREAGFTQVRSAARDIDALVTLILADLPPSATLLHAGNAESRGDLVGQLHAAGRTASFRALYRAASVTHAGPFLAAHIAGESRLDAALIHSPRAAHILADLLANTPQSAIPPLVAISAAAAAPLATRASGLAIALAPDENSLLDALEDLLRA